MLVRSKTARTANPVRARVAHRDATSRVAFLTPNDVSLDGLSCVGFEPERIAESGLELLMGLHKAGVVSVSA